MNLQTVVVSCLVVISSATIVQPVEAQQDAAANRPKYKVSVGGVPDTGQFLPNDAVLARVGEKNITVDAFIDGYFSSLAEFRPRPDSIGRVEFLDAMVNKEVMGTVAWEANRPLEFEDRTTLRGHAHRVLSNVLYRRMVIDSIDFSDEEIEREYETYKWQVRVRHILADDGTTADRVYHELKRGKIGWGDAERKYSTSEASGEDGELGWMVRMGADPGLAELIWSLHPGEISAPFNDPSGYHIFQCLERRENPAPSIEAVRKQIEATLRQRGAGRLADGLRDRLAQELGMTFDTTRIQWATSQFTPPRQVTQQAGGPSITINTHLPHFDAADTSHVLARYDGGVITLGTLLKEYENIHAAARPALNTFEAMARYLRSIATDDRRVELARSMGLEQDPLYMASMRKREEQMRVEHMYGDSIMSTLYVTKEARSAYYESHVNEYRTWAKVRYARMHADSPEGADSLKALLESGADAAELIQADSLAGREAGVIEERAENERGENYDLLFNALQTGDITVLGPDVHGHLTVLQMLGFDSGRQLSFDEAEAYVYESVQNIQAEEALQALIARHKSRFEIETHPELVMRIRLVDPAL